ncbi:hypothetical protein V5O48_015724, partial [Marasmius crinis-equi]
DDRVGRPRGMTCPSVGMEDGEMLDGQVNFIDTASTRSISDVSLSDRAAYTSYPHPSGTQRNYHFSEGHAVPNLSPDHHVVSPPALSYPAQTFSPSNAFASQRPQAVAIAAMGVVSNHPYPDAPHSFTDFEHPRMAQGHLLSRVDSIHPRSLPRPHATHGVQGPYPTARNSYTAQKHEFPTQLSHGACDGSPTMTALHGHPIERRVVASEAVRSAASSRRTSGRATPFVCRVCDARFTAGHNLTSTYERAVAGRSLISSPARSS